MSTLKAKSSDAEASDTKHSGQQTQRKGEKKWWADEEFKDKNVWPVDCR